MTKKEYDLILSVIRFSRSSVEKNIFNMWCNIYQDNNSIYDDQWKSLIEKGYVIYNERPERDLINYMLTEKAVDYIAQKENISIEKSAFFIN